MTSWGSSENGSACELHVSRNTVRKILRSDETSFSYERERQPKPKIGPWQDQLDGFLNGNRGKARHPVGDAGAAHRRAAVAVG